MIKKITILALIALLLPVWLIPVPVQAAPDLAVVSSTVKADFPASLTFNITAEGDTSITDIRLHYMVERMAHAWVTSEIYLEFTPATTVSEEWVWDMRKTGGLPPGSSLSYWWTVKDAAGRLVVTTPTRVDIEDDRYSWHSISRGMITIYWYNGNDTFAGKLMDIAQQALTRLSDNYGITVDRPVKIYVYNGTGDLRDALVFPIGWEGGVEYPRYGISVVSITTSELDWAAEVIPHELAHLVVHQVIFSPYADLPTWLDEGLAMYAEAQPRPDYAAVMEDATRSGNLITVRSLSSPFSVFGNEAVLAYYQSYSLVQYLVEIYGQQKMFDLLSTFKEGNTYDAALSAVYGFDTEGLDGKWRDSLMSVSAGSR